MAGSPLAKNTRSGRAHRGRSRKRWVRAYDPYVVGAAVVSRAMADDAEVCGVVVGAPGELIAGWARLGQRGTRNVLRAPVTIRTDDGHEVKLEKLEDATLGPVRRRKAEWQAHEMDALTALCLDEAPAPDVEVELVTARICGGDRIAVSGTVVERGFATDASSADGAFRTAAESTVSVLKPAFVATGDDAVVQLAQLIEASAKRPEPPVSSPAPKPAPAKVAPAPVAKPKPPSGIHDRLAPTFAPWIALALIAASAALAVLFPERRDLALLVAGVCAALPLAYDVGKLPPFRVLPPGLRKNTHPSSVTFLVLAMITVVGAMWATTAAQSRKPDEQASAVWLRKGALVGGALTAACIGWCISASRGRRRLMGLIERAAPHPQPLVDGVWGSTEGTIAFQKAGAPRVNEVPHAVTDGEHIRATGTRNSKGVWSGSNTTNLQGAVSELEVVHAAGRTRVGTHGGLWWSSVHYDRSTPDFSKTDRVDVIPEGAQLRVVGRAKGGVLVKGGAESLLVFAVGAGRDVAGELRALRRRDQLALGFAGGGLLAIVAGLVHAIVA